MSAGKPGAQRRSGPSADPDHRLPGNSTHATAATSSSSRTTPQALSRANRLGSNRSGKWTWRTRPSRSIRSHVAEPAIYPAPDVVALALAAELEMAPGSAWAYNNKAVNLLAGIFEKSAGRPMDEWIWSELLAPLCVTTRAWYRDGSGVTHAMAGVELTPLELARVGQLVLQEGRWDGRQVVGADWIRRLITPHRRCSRVRACSGGCCRRRATRWTPGPRTATSTRTTRMATWGTTWSSSRRVASWSSA